MEQQREISVEDFIKSYTPSPSMVLVQKDAPAKKSAGNIVYAQTTRDVGGKYAGTGVIRKMSPFTIDREPYDGALMEVFSVGQRVAFSNTTPFDVSIPAFCTFKREDEDARLVIIHIADLFGIIDLDKLDGKD